MDQEQAQRLGGLLRRTREARGWTTTDVAGRAGIAQSNLVRIELGQIANPGPEQLARLAAVLELNLVDVYQLANYPLPSLPAYLRSKYRDLPAPAHAELRAYLAELAEKYGMTPDGPEPGEDEADDITIDDQESERRNI